MFKKGNTKNKDGMLASCNISKLIAKDGKPHGIGETLIIPVISEVITTVMNQNAAEFRHLRHLERMPKKVSKMKS